MTCLLGKQAQAEHLQVKGLSRLWTLSIYIINDKYNRTES